MAARDVDIAEFVVYMLESSDEEAEVILPILPNIVDDDDDHYNVLRALQQVIEGIQRINRVKVVNYIENVVRTYIEHDFIMHFRLSRNVTYELVNRFEASEAFTALREYAGFSPITPEKHILAFLWFVGYESASYRDVADRFGVTLSTLHKIISSVTSFFMSIMPSIIRFPTFLEKQETMQHYLREKRFPGIIGSIDGSHIRIDKPSQDKDSYINRKQYFSIQLQGVVDHRRKFIDVFIGYPGSVHDARLFRESPLFNDLDELCGESGYLIGDSAYPCLRHLIVPYRDNGHLTRAQTNFNQRLSSCRVVIENAFGCLKQRFRQLYHFKLRDIVRMVQIIHTCCILHNLANNDDIALFEPPLEIDDPDPAAGNVEIPNWNQVIGENQQGRDLRDELCRQLAAQ